MSQMQLPMEPGRPWERRPGWPGAANDWNRAERCSRCGVTGERLQPDGRGDLGCYACWLGRGPA